MKNELNQINILYLIKTMDVGGAEKFTLNLCKYFSAKVKKIVVYSSGGIFVKQLEKINIEHIKSERANSGNLLKIRSEISKIISHGNFDIIHSQHRIFLPILKTINTGTAKIIYTANNFFDDIYQKLLFADLAVAISPSIQNNLFKTTFLSKDKIRRVNYGVEINRPHNKENGKFVLGFIGRLIKEKGINQLVEAIKKINQNNVELIICGDGPEKNDIYNIVNHIPENKIQLLEPLINIDTVYDKIDALILPTSLNEGLPISILEALIKKKIVISTNSGAITDVVVDNETGLILENNSPKCILEKITWILNNKREIELIKEKGYQKVKTEYSMKAMLEGYERLYIDG